MNWESVRLIYLRELKDQLRDRRTLFTILVLPLILYPLLGMTFLNVTQFLKEHPTRVWVIGAKNLPSDTPLFDGEKFALGLCPETQARLLQLFVADERPENSDLRELARKKIEGGEYDAVVNFPPTFAEELARFRQELANRQAAGSDSEEKPAEVPMPEIYVNTAADKSRMAYERVDAVLMRWREAIAHENLRRSHVPVIATRPFEVKITELAEEEVKRAAVWSKILPFVVLIWALTGAFYPAVDLCAGEKERGTLETLLTSPARRSEIVAGKLLTVMTFSMATSLLNLASMGLTGTFILAQMSGMHGMPASMSIGPPPWFAFAWLIVALIPCSALFSALSLAIAAFAKSSKEGQYYLMPLLLVSLPLMMLPLLPAAELDLGMSFIPITGVLLLLRAIIEGQVWDAVRFFIPVTAVTIGCCWLAVRWAVDQFNNESVLFREGERFDLRLWFKHLFRDRGDTPTVQQALLCGVLLLMIRFFGGLAASMPETPEAFTRLMIVTQIAFFATPVCLMAIILTRRPDLTLSLGRPSFWSTIPAAGLLALTLHPLVYKLAEAINYLYPISERTKEQLMPFEVIFKTAPLPYMLLAVAVVPAICEELAFRGFILSGLRRMGHKWGAIAISAAFFGVAHTILQQSLAAFVAGLILGYIAVKTSSLWPAVTFHLVHNGTKVLDGRLSPTILDDYPWLNAIWQKSATGGYEFTLTATLVGAALSLAIILWLKRLPYREFAEEKLQDALDRQEGPLEYAAR